MSNCHHQGSVSRGGTELEFSKLNRARAFTSRARAELRAQMQFLDC